MATTTQPVTEQAVREVLAILAATYHGRGSVELGDPYKVLVATVISARTRIGSTVHIVERRFPGGYHG